MLLRMLPDRHVADWWLAFRATKMWYGRFLEPGFGHVSALTYVSDRWVYYDPGSDYHQIEVIDAPEARPYDLLPGCKLVRVVAQRRREVHRYPWFLGPVTCVESIKALLGIDHPWLWTPHQLYRYCRAQGFRLE